jgi:multidrug efflux pump subunit AcrB
VSGPEHAAKERAADEALVARERNTARYFSEHRHVAWVALLFTVLWGVYGYVRMPKKKDPTFEVPVAVVACAWPGARADQIEQLITRKIEQKLGENAHVDKIESISRTSTSIVYVKLKEDATDRAKDWLDIDGRLQSIRDLPQGAGPIVFQKDFGDTTTLMLTVASPRVSDVELDLRTRAVAQAIEAARAGAAPGPRATLVVGFPPELDARAMTALATEAKRHFETIPTTRDARTFQGPGFLGLDLATALDDVALRERLHEFVDEHLRLSELHPDVWQPAVVRDPAATRAQLEEVAGARYSYHDLDLYTDTLQRYLQTLPIVARVTRSGVLPEQIDLEYSQAKLAGYGLDPSALGKVLAARNITAPGGILDVGGKAVAIDPSGAFTSESEIGNVVVATARGAPVYLRDIVDVRREYQSPPRFLNFLSTLDGAAKNGKLVQRRAITLAVDMRAGAQIGDFARDVDAQLAIAKRLLPEDLVVARTSDQPLQVKENVDLFMRSLFEAIVIVVLVALIGFWEWRTALLLALSIPITLAMTFGLMHAFGVDIQQISIVSLIIALGLLIDDPVVASDAIKNSMAAGWSAKVAAWLGPTKLATAILYATITNIVAYLPFLTLTGDVGKFIWSLPVVLSLSLVASRIVSMTFVPLLGGALLRAPKVAAPTPEERRALGFGRLYCRVVGFAVDHRLLVTALSLSFLVAGGLAAKRVKQAFFPKDLSYLCYVDVWLAEDQPLSATRAKAAEVQAVLAEAADEWSHAHPERDGKPLLGSVTQFVGGGGPRFWFSVTPELQQQNYAQLILQVRDKEATNALVPFLQERLSRRVAGARIDVRQLESGKPVGVPLSIRISGDDVEQLRAIAERTKAMLRDATGVDRVRDDWGSDTFAVKLVVDADRANLAGVTNLDVAASSATAMNGAVVGQLREGDRQIDMVVRMRPEDRVQLGDVDDLYVYGHDSTQRVPIGQVSKITYSTQTEKIRRRNHFRTITVSAFPAPGLLPSEALGPLLPKLEAMRSSLPPGYTLEIGGEHEEQLASQAQMSVVAVILIVAIYAALVVQFKHAVKPLIVFCALPFGVAAAFASLWLTGAPLGFMAILGIISLMGVIVSHVIVLFDFIEEAQERGAPMREALLDAGLMRLRPVLITVVATVLGLVPLAVHGGPLWEPLCYAQIGGLSFATVVTLVLVPVLYTIFVRDLRLVRWATAAERPA